LGYMGILFEGDHYFPHFCLMRHVNLLNILDILAKALPPDCQKAKFFETYLVGLTLTSKRSKRINSQIEPSAKILSAT